MFTKKTLSSANTDTPCRKKANVCEKTFTKTVTVKNSLTTKLPANANFVIFHSPILGKLLIS